MYRFFLGDYTDQNINSEAPAAEGIYRFSLTDEGKMEEAPKLCVRQSSPSYFCMNRSGSVLYCAAEPTKDTTEKGRVAAYKVNQKTGELTLFSEQEAPGQGLCHVCLDPEEKNLIAICYPDATVQVYPLDEEGGITPMFCLRRHIGSGPVLERQESAHAHSATFTPDGRYVIICDLGMDELVVYTMIPSTGKLHRAYNQNVTMPAGSGPRHLVFSPDGRFAYVSCELSSEVVVLSYNKDAAPDEPCLKVMVKISTQSPEFSSSTNYPAAIRITSDGRFLYVSNRGEDSITLFSINTATGYLQRIKNFSTMGWYPRDFILTRDEKFLLAVNQLSDNLVVYKRDPETGLLSSVEEAVMVQKPICLQELL